MFNPVFFPTGGGGSGGGAGSGFFRKRTLLIDQVNQRDFMRYTFTTGVYVADILALAQAVEPSLQAKHIDLTIRAIGGGPGGAVGDPATENLWGGMPGAVVTKSINLDDVDPSMEIYIEVGAAGFSYPGYSDNGSMSYVSVPLKTGQQMTMVADGGQAGRATDLDQQISWAYARQAGVDLLDPTIFTPINGSVEHSQHGPGQGGPFPRGSIPGYGGNGSVADHTTYSFAGVKDGYEHFDACGAGGSVSSDLDVRRGGTPGGGAAAGDMNAGEISHLGGDGEVRIQASIWEAV